MTDPWDARIFTYITLVFQNSPVIPCEDRCLEPLKAEPQEVFFGGPFTPPQQVFGRLGLNININQLNVDN